MSDARELRALAESQLGVPSKLHEYQWEGVAFLYRSKSALLADEMGLGKTVQTAVALALLLNGNNNINRALIVAPASLTANWMMELATWAPSLTKRLIQGPSRSREAYYLLPVPVLVGSYEQIRQDAIDRIPSGTFDLIILDEAQRIKNRNSATALGCRILPRTRAWALSATPLENSEDDLLSILSFLTSSINQSASAASLATQLQSIMIRRRKAEVRGELPPVILQDLQLELTAPQRKEYDELWIDRVEALRTESVVADSSTALLSLITKLKILCNYSSRGNASSKLSALEAIKESAGESARILIFSQFVKTLQWISNRLGIRHDLLTGSMSVPTRHEAMKRFRKAGTPRALLVSLKAGGVGLNLGEATHVVLFDRWWNPAVESQAIFRAHRFQRQYPLHVIRFLVRDSIEERIATILERKEILFHNLVDSGPSDSQAHQFTRGELMQILEITDGDILPTKGEKAGGRINGEDC
ncbi:MAG: DEAD/DEAH box helicase [Gammaproteobacteria bacterium]|nr:DEAD/DEAH box helicase [Gammaproteobacteria bacterium]